MPAGSRLNASEPAPALASDPSREDLRRVREFLLLAVRPGLTAAETGRLQSLMSSGLNPALLLEAAAFHLVEPLVWRNVSTLEGVPEEVRKKLRLAHVSGSARNLQLTSVATKLHEQFAQAAIPMLSLKGPVLAVEAYGEVTGRWFSDVDILVHRSDAARAIALLQRCGFAPVFDLSGRWQERYLRRFYEVSFRDRLGVCVDLHWSLLDPQFSFCPDEAEAWGGVRSVDVNGTSLSTLSAEMTAKYLCLHVAKHHWDRLGWLADVAQWMACGPAVDWRALAMDSAAGRFVMVTLGLIERLFERPAPPEVAGVMRADPVVQDQIASVESRLLTATPFRITRSAQWRTEFGKAMPSTGDRWRSFYSTLFRPSILEWRAIPLPPALSPLYAVIRPCRLLWKRLAGPGKRMG